MNTIFVFFLFRKQCSHYQTCLDKLDNDKSQCHAEPSKSDPQMPHDRSNEEYQRSRRMIQNNLDACRYFSAEMNLFSKFLIPANQDPPRAVMIAHPRPQQPPPEQ